MADEPAPLPPPGTETPTFFQNHAVKTAIVMTVVFVNAAFLRPWFTAHLGDGNAILAEGLEWAWLAAVGLERTDTSALRWK